MENLRKRELTLEPTLERTYFRENLLYREPTLERTYFREKLR